MENFRKLAKIAALDQKIPGPVCGNPDCEDLCAEAYDAALSLRLDPAETVRKTIERELHCLPAAAGDDHVCRFGFVPASDSLVLSAKKKKEDNEVIHIFRTGVNECKKCQALEGTRISVEIWADEEKMKAKGFWKQKNGEYLPHPNCKCHWEEKIIKPQIENSNARNEKDDERYMGRSVTAKVKGAPGPYFGTDLVFDGSEDLISQLEKRNPPHSIGRLVLINHGRPGEIPVGKGDQLENFDKHPVHRANIQRLRKLLSPYAIVEIRMCDVGSGDGGRIAGQKLADMLGCRVKVYEESVTAHATRPWIKKGPFSLQNGFKKPESRIYYPRR